MKFCSNSIKKQEIWDFDRFQQEFDEISKAENLESLEEITKLRKNLDQQLITFQDLITKLANKLQRQLLASQKRATFVIFVNISMDIKDKNLNVHMVTQI